MNLTPQRLRLILLGLLGASLLIFGATVFLGLSNLNKKSQGMVALKTKSKTVDAQVANLSKAKKDVDKYKYFNQVAVTVIPNDKNQAQAVSDIFQIASQSGLLLENVTFPSSTLGLKLAIPPTSTSTTPQSTVSSDKQKLLSQAKPVAGIAGLYSIELTITPQTGSAVPNNLQVTYPKLLDFLNRIERNRRTAQITQVSIQPLGNTTSPSQFINFTLSINIFIKP
jgi:hypothetical protein